MDVEFLDQGKQTKRVHVPDRIGPPEPSGVESNGKGVMEMRNGGNVPTVTGQGACTEAVCVISKISDKFLDDLKGQSGCRRLVCCRGLWGNFP